MTQAFDPNGHGQDATPNDETDFGKGEFIRLAQHWANKFAPTACRLAFHVNCRLTLAAYAEAALSLIANQAFGQFIWPGKPVKN
jgi:hypothetical protein